MQEKNTTFSKILLKEKNRLELNQDELRTVLHGVPLRTLQSWLYGEKEPPEYLQKLVIEKLKIL